MGKYRYGPLINRDVVPLSDGAHEMVAVGRDVTQFEGGERMVTTLLPTNPPWTLSTQLYGCLTEYAVFCQDGLLPVPAHLSFEDAATLTCAGVTARNALMYGRDPCGQATPCWR